MLALILTRILSERGAFAQMHRGANLFVATGFDTATRRGVNRGFRPWNDFRRRRDRRGHLGHQAYRVRPAGRMAAERDPLGAQARQAGHTGLAGRPVGPAVCPAAAP